MSDRVPREAERFCRDELSEADYYALQALADRRGVLARILSENGHASWTVCPRCRVDDFTHVEGCPLA